MLCTQGKNFGPLMGCEFVKDVPLRHAGRERHFKVVTFQAYNAMGLIGPEMTGVGLVDEDNKIIVWYSTLPGENGYFATPPKAKQYFDSIVSKPNDELFAYLDALIFADNPTWF